MQFSDKLVEDIARTMCVALGHDPDEMRTIGMGENRVTIPYWMMQREWAIRHLAAQHVIHRGNVPL